MNAPLFYSAELDSDLCVLAPDESRHCVGVLRRKQGDRVRVFSGDGRVCTAEIVEANPRAALLRIVEQTLLPRRKYRLHLAVAPTKNFDRYEWFVEKATEIGVASITPLICTRSERKASKHERIEKTVVAAMKQSGNLLKPILNGDTGFDDFVLRPFDGLKCLAHCEKDNKPHFTKLVTAPGDFLLIVGPEGDFTPDEIAEAKSKGFVPVGLGDSVLRTETAAVFACAIVAAAEELKLMN